MAYNYTLASLTKRWSNLLSEHLEPLWPEDMLNESKAEEQKFKGELRAGGRRRQLLPALHVLEADGGEQRVAADTAAAEGLDSQAETWAVRQGCLRRCLRRLHQWLLRLVGWGAAEEVEAAAVRGGTGLEGRVWAVADSRQRRSRWLQGSLVVPWFWRSEEFASGR
jgi:hypothetical protein